MNRYWLIGIACVVGAVSIAPYLIAYTSIQTESEERLHYFYQDSEHVYLSRIREGAEGHVHIAAPMFAEYKDAPVIQQPYGELLYALGALGNPEYVVGFALFSKFLFPAILFVLVYLVASHVLRGVRGERERTNVFVALLIGTFVLLGFDLVNVGYVKDVFTGSFTSHALSIWTRLVNPITGALGLFWLFYLLLTLERGSKAFKLIAAGLVLGFMSGYIFSFALGLVTVFLLALFAALGREWERVRGYSSILLIAVIVNAQYFFAMLRGSGDLAPLLKSGLLLSHEILHNKALYLVCFVLACTIAVLHRYTRDVRSIARDHTWQWIGAVILGGLVCLNVQVVTGKTVWPGHFVQYTNPIAMLVVIVCVTVLYDVLMSRILKVKERLADAILVGGALVSIAVVVFTFVRTYESVSTNRAYYEYTQKYVPTLSWLRERGGDPCVVFVLEAEEQLEKFITAYTQCDLYLSSYVFSAVPQDRILHNYVVQLRLLGVTPEHLDAYLEAQSHDMRRYFFEDWVDMFYNAQDEWVFYSKSEEAREAFMPKYLALVKAEYVRTLGTPVTELLHRYAIDYILIDTHFDSPSEALGEYPVIFESNGLLLLKVPQTKAGQGGGGEIAM